MNPYSRAGLVFLAFAMAEWFVIVSMFAATKADAWIFPLANVCLYTVVPIAVIAIVFLLVGAKWKR